MTTATNEKEKIVNNDINTINQSLGNTYNTIQTNETELDEIAFFNKNIGALICNDIGKNQYNEIYTNAVESYSSITGDDNFDKNSKDFLAYLKEQFSECENIEGYEIIDFSMNEATGFQGGIYYNETTGDYVVVCRGTEFKSGNEEFYKDFVQTDVLEFGKDIVPSAFYDTEELLIRAIDSAGGDHSKVHIVGHSLGGGIAQLLGSLEDYKDIDVTTYNPVGVEHLLNEEGIKNRVQTGADKFSNIINYATCNDFVSTIFKCVGKMEMIKCVGLPEMTLYMAARATMTSEAAKALTLTYSIQVMGMMLLKKLISIDLLLKV